MQLFFTIYMVMVKLLVGPFYQVSNIYSDIKTGIKCGN